MEIEKEPQLKALKMKRGTRSIHCKPKHSPVNHPIQHENVIIHGTNVPLTIKNGINGEFSSDALLSCEDSSHNPGLILKFIY